MADGGLIAVRVLGCCSWPGPHPPKHCRHAADDTADKNDTAQRLLKRRGQLATLSYQSHTGTW